jgi:phage gp29-like protein
MSHKLPAIGYNIRYRTSIASIVHALPKLPAIGFKISDTDVPSWLHGPCNLHKLSAIVKKIHMLTSY